jgi:feruloyl esterase
MLGAIDQWVQSGKAPEQLVASNPPGRPARTRPLCPYPKVASYTGHGDTDEAQNFRCEAP